MRHSQKHFDLAASLVGAFRVQLYSNGWNEEDPESLFIKFFSAFPGSFDSKKFRKACLKAKLAAQLNGLRK